ncbi:hypothetical protein Tco_0525812 [Tanacetum coccineum]
MVENRMREFGLMRWLDQWQRGFVGRSCLIPKVLNALIGHGNSLFRRSKLKALGSIHGQETAEEAMTPIESAFSLDVNSKLECLVFYNENEMHDLTALIVYMAKQENLFASQGEPITFAKVKNEYGNVMASCVYAP